MSRPSIPEKTNYFSDLDRYNNTKTVVKEDDSGSVIRREVILHGTPIGIVFWNDGKLFLGTGGYKTATTKRRMNEFLDVIDVSYYVRSMSGTWYVLDLDDNVVAEFDGDSVTIDL